MSKESSIISKLVTPFDRLSNPAQYSTYSSTSGASYPVQIPALYVPSEMRPLNVDRFTEFDYEILMQLDNEKTRTRWGITVQPEESKEYFKVLDTLLDDAKEILLMKEMVSDHPETFFPILRRIRLLQQYDDVSQRCINFKTNQMEYDRRTGLAALHSLTFETVGVWSSDFDEVSKRDYSPKLVVAEECIDRLTEDISIFQSEYVIDDEADERSMIRNYAKERDAVLIVRITGGRANDQDIADIYDHWLPDAVVAPGDESDHYRPRAYVVPSGSIYAPRKGLEKWGPVRKWFMNQEQISSAYASQYPLARKKQMLDREELRSSSPVHHQELAPYDPGTDNIAEILCRKKLQS